MPGNQVIGKDVELIGQEVVADHLGVTSQAISNWYARGLEDLPVFVPIQFKTGKKPAKVWKRAQLPAWQKWHDAHLAERGQHVPKRNRPDQMTARAEARELILEELAALP